MATLRTPRGEADKGASRSHRGFLRLLFMENIFEVLSSGEGENMPLMLSQTAILCFHRC